MKKLIVSVLALVPLLAFAEARFLDYQLNENVIVRISNLPCNVKGIDGKKFPFKAAAIRIDSQVLPGCFTNDKDEIVIQWGAGGDQSRFPANYFLVGPKAEPTT